MLGHVMANNCFWRGRVPPPSSFFLRHVPLCSPAKPRTPRVEQSGLELTEFYQEARGKSHPGCEQLVC